MFPSGCQQVKIEENCERSVASKKKEIPIPYICINSRKRYLLIKQNLIGLYTPGEIELKI